MTETRNQMDNISLKKDTLSNRIVDILMNRILDGELKMGDKLNTEELARQLGVSRMPVRDAINNLESLGIAESIPYVGVRLISLDQKDVIEIYLVRKALEPLVAKEACKHVTDQDIVYIKSICDEYIEIVSKNKIEAKELYLINRKFHFAIYRISKLDRICNIIENSWRSLSFFKFVYGINFVKSDKNAMINEHLTYIKALETRDGDLFKKTLEKNFDDRINKIHL